MTWEERLLFLMYLDYKGVLKKWERNHDKCDCGYRKIDHDDFNANSGFSWEDSPQGYKFWNESILGYDGITSWEYQIEKFYKVKE